MKIATWNVNSLRVRLEQVLDWLNLNQPDVLALQETKLTDELFPADKIAEAGYRSVFSGQKTYNGVAILTRGEPAGVERDLHGFEDEQRRFLACTVGGVRVLNLYVPNGQSVDSDKYEYKLRWLDALADTVEDELSDNENVVVVGDFNIAPDDRDVHDPKAWEGAILVSEPERAALARILDLGFTDTFRLFDQAEASFSWWDYRAAGFRRNLGLRIDLILASRPLAQSCAASSIDTEPRRLERPSDHAPAVAAFNIRDSRPPA